MDESLNQPCRVRDEGPLDCKPLLSMKKCPVSTGFDGNR
jgi:hypothetical protein